MSQGRTYQLVGLNQKRKNLQSNLIKLQEIKKKTVDKFADEKRQIAEQTERLKSLEERLSCLRGVNLIQRISDARTTYQIDFKLSQAKASSSTNIPTSSSSTDSITSEIEVASDSSEEQIDTLQVEQPRLPEEIIEQFNSITALLSESEEKYQEISHSIYNLNKTISLFSETEEKLTTIDRNEEAWDHFKQLIFLRLKIFSTDYLLGIQKNSSEKNDSSEIEKEEIGAFNALFKGVAELKISSGTERLSKPIINLFFSTKIVASHEELKDIALSVLKTMKNINDDKYQELVVILEGLDPNQHFISVKKTPENKENPISIQFIPPSPVKTQDAQSLADELQSTKQLLSTNLSNFTNDLASFEESIDEIEEQARNAEYKFLNQIYLVIKNTIKNAQSTTDQALDILGKQDVSIDEIIQAKKMIMSSIESVEESKRKLLLLQKEASSKASHTYLSHFAGEDADSALKTIETMNKVIQRADLLLAEKEREKAVLEKFEKVILTIQKIKIKLEKRIPEFQGNIESIEKLGFKKIDPAKLKSIETILEQKINSITEEIEKLNVLCDYLKENHSNDLKTKEALAILSSFLSQLNILKIRHKEAQEKIKQLNHFCNFSLSTNLVYLAYNSVIESQSSQNIEESLRAISALISETEDTSVSDPLLLETKETFLRMANERRDILQHLLSAVTAREQLDRGMRELAELKDPNDIPDVLGKIRSLRNKYSAARAHLDNTVFSKDLPADLAAEKSETVAEAKKRFSMHLKEEKARKIQRELDDIKKQMETIVSPFNDGVALIKQCYHAAQEEAKNNSDEKSISDIIRKVELSNMLNRVYVTRIALEKKFTEADRKENIELLLRRCSELELEARQQLPEQKNNEIYSTCQNIRTLSSSINHNHLGTLVYHTSIAIDTVVKSSEKYHLMLEHIKTAIESPNNANWWFHYRKQEIGFGSKMIYVQDEKGGKSNRHVPGRIVKIHNLLQKMKSPNPDYAKILGDVVSLAKKHCDKHRTEIRGHTTTFFSNSNNQQDIELFYLGIIALQRADIPTILGIDHTDPKKGIIEIGTQTYEKIVAAKQDPARRHRR
jgi:hypothetical protein